MPKLFFSLFCTNLGLSNKNPMGFKFSVPVFPCFWQLKDLIYANYMLRYVPYLYTKLALDDVV